MSGSHQRFFGPPRPRYNAHTGQTEYQLQGNGPIEMPFEHWISSATPAEVAAVLQQIARELDQDMQLEVGSTHGDSAWAHSMPASCCFQIPIISTL